MINLGQIQINHPQSFIEARNKIHAIADLFADDRLTPTRLAIATSQICRSLHIVNKISAEEDVVAQCQRTSVSIDKVLANDKSIRQSSWAVLNRIGKIDSPLSPATKYFLKSGSILRS